MAAKRKKGISVYILPILFCALLIGLAVLKNGTEKEPVKAVLQAGEPLVLTEQAIENYLYSAGFTLTGEAILDADGKEAGALTVTRDENDTITGMTLSFPLPTYYETEGDSDILLPLKANHDAGIQRGEDLFLALFDAIAATDGRAGARRDSALEKLGKTMDTGKAATQASNTWRFAFSLEPGDIEGTVTVLFTLVK